jgi:hypothetical protein
MAATRGDKVAELLKLRAAAIALSDELIAKLDLFPRPELMARLRSVVSLINGLDGRLASLGVST